METTILVVAAIVGALLAFWATMKPITLPTTGSAARC